MRLILARLFGDALPRLGHQRVAIAADGGARRTRRRARCRLSFGLALVALVAFADLGQPRRPFVGWHLEGASRHAIAAAHALVGIVDDRPERRFVERPYRADRCAGGLL